MFRMAANNKVVELNQVGTLASSLRLKMRSPRRKSHLKRSSTVNKLNKVKSSTAMIKIFVIFPGLGILTANFINAMPLKGFKCKPLVNPNVTNYTHKILCTLVINDFGSDLSFKDRHLSGS